MIHHNCPFIRVVHLHFCKISFWFDPQDYAGTRSDFVVVGHPEYNLGKACAEMGKILENWPCWIEFEWFGWWPHDLCLCDHYLWLEWLNLKAEEIWSSNNSIYQWGANSDYQNKWKAAFHKSWTCHSMVLRCTKIDIHHMFVHIGFVYGNLMNQESLWISSNCYGYVDLGSQNTVVKGGSVIFNPDVLMYIHVWYVWRVVYFIFISSCWWFRNPANQLRLVVPHLSGEGC